MLHGLARTHGGEEGETPKSWNAAETADFVVVAKLGTSMDNCQGMWIEQGQPRSRYMPRRRDLTPLLTGLMLRCGWCLLLSLLLLLLGALLINDRLQ